MEPRETGKSSTPQEHPSADATLNTEAHDEARSTTASTPPAEVLAPADLTEPGYAGFWKRFFAYVIDFALLSLVFIVVGIFAAAFGWIDASSSEAIEQSSAKVDILSILISWGYFALMESSSKQATLGKMALSIQVTNSDGGKISFLRATVRFFAKYLSAVILLIGFIMVAFTAKKQGLHDFIAGTLVVNKS